MRATSTSPIDRPQNSFPGEQRPHAEQRYAALLRRVVPWEWDAAADRIVASQSLAAVYGVPAIENVSRGFTLVHPDDHDRHEAMVLDAVDRGRGYASTFRIIVPDSGAVTWIDERAEAIRHRPPEPPELIGVAFDASIRHESDAPAAALRALAAFEEFGDTLLAAHASNRRRAPRASRMAPGTWVTEATRAFDQLAASVDVTTSDAADIIREATRTLRDQRS
jgi:hypothetical protein